MSEDDRPVSRDPQVVAEILSRLDLLEADEDVVILLAVESGSRAWGFWSADSDYDVRFIYVRRPETYLTIAPPRDVIERPIVDEIDLGGWDIRKALALFRKSNPPLLEWLQCPLVYRERLSLAEHLRRLLPVHWSPRASFHHYLNMAKGNFREYLHGETVWRKKYLYVLRPLLAMRWIEAGLGPVPIEFDRLVEATVQADDVRRSISTLLAEKRAGGELDRGPHDPVLGRFIEDELARLEAAQIDREDPVPGLEELDRLFRETLREAWGDALPR